MDDTVLQSRHRQRLLAGFYGWYIGASEAGVTEWTLNGGARPVPGLPPVVHVSVAAQAAYALDTEHRAWVWTPGTGHATLLLDEVVFAAAGESSLLVIRSDGSLWQRKAGNDKWLQVAHQAVHASVGDSSDYFIDTRGQLWATGLAHRGQYGNGQLTETQGWVAVAGDALAVTAHTGHAVYLRKDGAVLGTGGNRFGPLGTHGFGDKADRWGVIFEGATRIATGSRHTLALRADGVLWGWGDADGVQARILLKEVTDFAAGEAGSCALTQDGRRWRWKVGTPPRLVLG